MMDRVITISVQGKAFKAVLNQCPTADAIWDALPVTSAAATWGDEIYFSTGVVVPLEPEASAVVKKYDIGYWPPGRAICIFFGQTPVSTPTEIRAASEVTIIGKIEADAADLRKVRDDAPIQVEKAE
jgi:uncharacterized protein